MQRTGSPLPKHTFFGKPNAQPYRLAEAALAEQAQQLGLLKGGPDSEPGTHIERSYIITCCQAGRAHKQLSGQPSMPARHETLSALLGVPRCCWQGWLDTSS